MSTEDGDLKQPLNIDTNDVNIKQTSSDTSTKYGDLKQPLNTDTDDVRTNTKHSPPDGGWGWIVCFTSMICNGTIFSIFNNFGILYTFLLTEYANEDPVISFKTSFVGSVCVGLTFLMNIIASILCDKFGIRPTAFVGATIGLSGLISSAFITELELLYLTFGVLLGLGGGLLYAPSLIILGHYFERRLGLANGIVSFGSSLFSIVLSITLPYLLKLIQIKYTFLVLASMYFVCMIGTLSWKEINTTQVNKERKHLENSNCVNVCCKTVKTCVDTRLLKDRSYVIWVMSCCIALFGYFGLFFHLVKHCNDIFPNENGSFLITCTQITSAIGRITYGIVADFRWANRILMHQTALVLMGVMFTCIPLSTGYPGLIAISLVLGLSDGAFVCLLGPIAFDIVGKNHASQAIGFLMGTFALPFTLGPPFLGFLYDKMRNYTLAFYISGAPPIIGAILMFLIPKAIKTHRPTENSSEKRHQFSDKDINPSKKTLLTESQNDEHSEQYEKHKLLLNTNEQIANFDIRHKQDDNLQ